MKIFCSCSPQAVVEGIRNFSSGPFAAGPLVLRTFVSGPLVAGPFEAGPIVPGPFEGGPFVNAWTVRTMDKQQGRDMKTFRTNKNGMGPDPGSLLYPEPDQDPGKKTENIF